MFYVKSTAGMYATSTGSTREKKEASVFRNKHDAEHHLGEIWNKLPLEGHWEVVKEDDPPEESLPFGTRFEKWLHAQGEVAQHDLIQVELSLLDMLGSKNPRIREEVGQAKTILNRMSTK